MSEWREVTLGDAGVSVLDCEHKTPAAQVEGFLYIAIPDIQGGRVNIEQSRRISAVDLVSWTKRTTPTTGDLLVTRRGRVGDSAPIPPDLKCAIGQNLVILRSDGEQVDQGFLRWAARSPKWWNEVDRFLNVGAVFSSLNVRDFVKFRLSLPPLAEQRAIAEVLGALDDKIAANTRLAATADEFAMQKYVGLTQAWEKVSLGDKLVPVLGGTPARAREDYWENGTHLWISAKDITGAQSRVVLDTAEKISDEAVSGTKAKPLPPGSVILTARGTVGEVARLVEPASFNQSCYGFVPGDVPASLLFYSVLSAAKHSKSLAHGSVFDTITKQSLDHLTMAWDEEEAPGVERELTSLLEVVETAVRENQTLAETRDALLPKLMSGQLRVRDAERIAEAAGA